VLHPWRIAWSDHPDCLNRDGDRQLNRVLHTMVLSRLTCDAETKGYADRRRAEGKTNREIRRCLKRHVARRVYRLLEHDTRHP
jgi:transposase